MESETMDKEELLYVSWKLAVLPISVFLYIKFSSPFILLMAWLWVLAFVDYTDYLVVLQILRGIYIAQDLLKDMSKIWL